MEEEIFEDNTPTPKGSKEKIIDYIFAFFIAIGITGAIILIVFFVR